MSCQQPLRPRTPDPPSAPLVPGYQLPAVGPLMSRRPAAVSSPWCQSLWPLWAARSSAATLFPVRHMSHPSFIGTTSSDYRLNLQLPSTDRNHHKDHHHPDDLQAERHRGPEDYRKGSNHPGPPRKERGHHTAERRGQSGRHLETFCFPGIPGVTSSTLLFLFRVKRPFRLCRAPNRPSSPHPGRSPR